MDIARRLRELRESRDLSQGDLQRRTGLFRCYISRVENGHTVPELPTLQKLAKALGIPLYQLFYEDTRPRGANEASEIRKEDWASSGEGYATFKKFQQALARMKPAERDLLLGVVQRVAKTKRKKPSVEEIAGTEPGLPSSQV